MTELHHACADPHDKKLGTVAAPVLVAESNHASLLDAMKRHVEGLSSSRLQLALRHALSLVGTPYVWGGDDARVDGGFDCLGFIYRIFHDAGLEFPLSRWSTLNMTNVPRSFPVQPLWWNEYTNEFAQKMRDCREGPFQDGDVLVYHTLKAGKVIDRTGHVVLVVDASQGYAISAARFEVKPHALGTLRRYEERELTACWRAPSAMSSPIVRPSVTWRHNLSNGKGTRKQPYVIKNPIDFEVEIQGSVAAKAQVVAMLRVNAFIGAVTPQFTEIPLHVLDQRRFRLFHDFRIEDLRVDPGEVIRTPLRKVVLRLVDDAGFVLAEDAFYLALTPYWH